MNIKKVNVARLPLLFVCLFTLFALVFYAMNTPVQAAEENTPYVEQQMIVMFQSGTSSHDIQTLIDSICPGSTLLEQEEDYILLELLNQYDIEDTIASFLQSSQVLVCEPNYIIQSLQISKDTYTKSQWALKNTGSYRSYRSGSNKKISSTEGIDLNIPAAWEKYNKRNGATEEVIVAIIDTGVDITHEDLAKNIWVNSGEIAGDGIDNDGNGYIDDVNGWDFYNDDATVYSSIYDSSSDSYSVNPDDNDDHGTHCAGIIAAVANNQTGIAGVASNINVKIMPLKIEGGKKGSGTITNAIKAIKYAESMGAKICNISWGSSVNSSSLELAMKESSMLFVAAAGNTGSNNDSSPIYPASYDLDNVISVTFINADGNLTSYSNYGKTSVDIAAPGYDILSTTVGNTYSSMSGSSMAVPHVSAIAALAYSSQSNLYASDVKDLILSNITALASLDGKVASLGIPDALKLVSNLNLLNRDTKKPTLSCSTSYSGSSIVVNLTAKDSGGSGIRVIKYLYGKQSLSAFTKGTVGTSVTEDCVTVAKAGIYTFYISDYAGNEKTVQYKVVDDQTAPTLKTSYTVSNDYSKFTIKVKATDRESGIKQVKYLAGNKSINDFKSSSAGTEVKNKNGSYKFTVKKPGTYTIYAVDGRGNKTVTTITVYSSD